MKSQKFAFTLVELLTVLAIVAMLVGLLIPSLTLIRNTAKEAQQKAQLTQIGLALTAFRTDYGDYPPSNLLDLPPAPPGPGDYCGAQKLAEALLGWDLLGFHPKSDFRSNGSNNAGVFVYDTTDPVLFGQRRGSYLERATANAFRLGVSGPGMQDGLFNNTGTLNPDRFVICDSFGVKKVTIAPGETARAGMPILYYRADPTLKKFDVTGIPPGSGNIYNFIDNFALIQVADSADGTPPGDHPLATMGGMYFYNPQYKIVDQKILSATGRPWPHRPDSYILISAGSDGKYGTEDDICNLGN